MGGRGSSSGNTRGFSKAQKAAISRFEEHTQKRWNVIGNINYTKVGGERVEATFITKDTFNRPRGGKMIHPDNYDVIERTSKRSITLLISSSGMMRMHNNPSLSEEKVISKHYYKPLNRKK